MSETHTIVVKFPKGASPAYSASTRVLDVGEVVAVEFSGDVMAERDRLARLLDEARRILENSTGNDRRTDYLRHELLEALAGAGE